MKKAYTVQELAEKTSSSFQGSPETLIFSVADIESATEQDVSFLSNPRYYSFLQKTNAGLVCVSPDIELVEGRNYLISNNPSQTFQQLIELFSPPPDFSGFQGIHPTAVIHPEAQIEEGVTIAPYATIDTGVKIGKNSYIGPFVYIGKGTLLGEECILYAHSIVREYCILGNRVILQPGAVIGSCGFGYTTTTKGEHVKLKQLGNVVLEDDVEIGANTTIDRARFKTTIVRRGTKIDNLVQIAHNVELGEHNLLAAQTGIAGSTKTGRHVFMGGQVGIVGHLEIADNVMIATRGGVSKSIKEKGKYAGGPVMTLVEHNRNQVYLRKIDNYAKKIDICLKKIEELEEKLENKFKLEEKEFPSSL